MSDRIEPPLSLYVHLPWCRAKCPYCDFNSHHAGESPPKRRYLTALETDLRAEAERAAGRPLVSVFLGGGTPSLFSPSEIGGLVETIAAEFVLDQDLEITMEANPGTVERGAMRDYAEAGVNRLSLGAQSFDAESLKRLGRIHGPAEIRAAFEEARAAGFRSINLDIMYALPGQNLDLALEDIAEAVSLGPAHISYYQLTLEPNTRFYSDPPSDLPDEDRSIAIQERGHALLRENGYEQYEISAFARRGQRCRHNLNYWTFGDYLGAGAGAHGKFTPRTARTRRSEKPRHPATYMEQAESGRIDAREREISPEDLAFEFMLNATRLPEGFGSADFTARTGLAIETVAAPLDLAETRGLIEATAGGFRPTALGLRFHNDLVAMFLP